MGIDLATMEGANESARAGVNALAEKRIDAQRWAAGQPNVHDRQ